MSSEDLTAEESQASGGSDKSPPAKVKQIFVVDTGPLMVLSLFLLLLAFFVLLVTMSEIDESRRMAVFNSVSASFIMRRPIQEDYEVEVSRIGDFVDDDYIELHKKLWLSLVPLASIKTERFGNIMELVIHSNDLFQPGTSTLKASSEIFVQRLVNATRLEDQVLRNTMVFQVDDILNIDTSLALRQYHGSDGKTVQFYDQKTIDDIFDPLRYFRDLQFKSDASFVIATNSDTLQFMRAMTMAHALEQAGANPEVMRVGIRERVGQTIQVMYEFFDEQ